MADRIAGGNDTNSIAAFAGRRKIEDRLVVSFGDNLFEEQMESLESLLDPSEIRQMRAESMLHHHLTSCRADRPMKG